MVGETKILMDILTKGYSGWLPLEYQGKKSAEILIETEYIPPKETWGDYQPVAPIFSITNKGSPVS